MFPIDGIQSCTQPKYVYTEYGTFQDIKHELKKVEGPVDTSNFTTVPWYDRDNVKRELRQGMLEMRASNCNNWNAAGAAEALEGTKAVMAEAKSAAGKFYDGIISGDELQAEYERLSERYVAVFSKSGYPSRLSSGCIQTRLGAQELFYDEFRKEILKEAVARNNAEGRQYATRNGSRVKYYNSDYYYKSEEAIDAITKGAFAVAEVSRAKCEELGYDEYAFEVPKYRSDMVKGVGNLYYNFNSVWSNNIVADEEFITDYDQVPPRNFQWFFESGGSSSDGDSDLPGWTEEPGKSGSSGKPASIWARWTDADGTMFFDASNFWFTDDGKGLFRVSELLKLNIGVPESASQVEQFLDSLQVFRPGYFRKHYAAGRMNVLA